MATQFHLSAAIRGDISPTWLAPERRHRGHCRRNPLLPALMIVLLAQLVIDALNRFRTFQLNGQFVLAIVVWAGSSLAGGWRRMQVAEVESAALFGDGGELRGSGLRKEFAPAPSELQDETRRPIPPESWPTGRGNAFHCCSSTCNASKLPLTSRPDEHSCSKMQILHKICPSSRLNNKVTPPA